MAELSWGKPSKFETAPSTAGVPSNSWRDLPIPKEGTLQLSTENGEEIVATEEGGDIVDIRYGKNKSTLEWDEYVKKGQNPSFEDNDGVVAGEHAFRVLPEDSGCEGILIERAVVRVTKSYNVADGILRHHTAKALKPASGKSVKPYANNLQVSKSELYFTNAADNTGKTVTATATGAITAASDQSWCTASVSGTTVTVKVTANSGSTARTANVTISDGSKSAIVVVTQIPA